MHPRCATLLYRYHAASLAVGLDITAACLLPMPAQDATAPFPHFDKLVHTVFYLVFTGAYLLETKNKPLPASLLKGVLYAALLAGGLEWAQGSLTTYRSAEWADFWCGMGGSAISCGVAIWLRRAFQSPDR
jgi:hypothetical protein